MSKAGKLQIAALKRSPTHLIYRVLQMAVDLYGQETGPRAVTQRQYTILAAVAESEGPSQNDLVRATGVDRSTLADLIARMTATGLLARERSSADGRAKVVTLTDQGRTALDEVRPCVAAADERLLALLPTKKRDSFMRLLQDLAKSSDALLRGADDEALQRVGPETDLEPTDPGAPRERRKKPVKGEGRKGEKKKRKKAAKARATAAVADAGEATASAPD